MKRQVITFWVQSPSLWTACLPFFTVWWTAESPRQRASSHRFLRWWPCSCWLRSVMTTSSTPWSTNVPFLWISSAPYLGLCVRVCVCTLILLMHMNETDWIIQVNWPFTVFLFFFFFTENLLCVIYLPGRWTLILSSICTTSCEPAVH